MKRTTPTLNTNEIAENLGVTRAAVTNWCRQGLFPKAFVEETARGPVWHIPRSDLKSFKKPKPGPPAKVPTKKKRKRGVAKVP